MEVAKTRLQLDGELGARGGIDPLTGKVRPKVYNNAVDALRKTWKFEGIRGLQRGLGAAVSLVRCTMFSLLSLFRFFREGLARARRVRGEWLILGRPCCMNSTAINSR